MAKDIAYFYDIIVAEKQTMSNLNGLQPSVDTSQKLLSDVTTKSRVARWRLWVWCVAVCIYAFYVLFDLFKIELEDIAQNSRFGQLPWYAEIAKEYQHGYNLVWINNSYQYSVVDEAAKIIKLSAADEIITGASAVVNLKVAKLISNTPTPLDATESAAFFAYIKKKKPGGIVVRVITDDGDDLQLFIKAGYDPLVISATGESLLLPGTFPVQDAINLFIKNLPFNGSLELCDLIDSIQKIYGITSAYVTNASARYGSNAFVPFLDRYKANAGFLVIFSGTPLNTSITYQANV